MSMTPASTQYFDQNAEKWDSLRTGFFSEAVRQAAFQKAYLHPQMVAADVGAGTGFMSAGLAPLVKHVHLVDGSAAMLSVAKRNLAAFENVSFHETDGLQLPFADGSLDVIFANMYLHHCPDPLAAIREMVRALKPAGRLVITDMDTHPYAWLKEEMADAWMGFERAQIRAWYAEAGLVNTVIDCTGESCRAQSENHDLEENQRKAEVSLFVASGTRRVSGAREVVQSEYSLHAQKGTSCCSSQPASGSGSGDSQLISLDQISSDAANFAIGYTPVELAAVPAESSELALGCGNPTAMANLKEGEVVLDIGSGAGLDAFLAARKVGTKGKVIGVDMTPAMLERARRAAEKAGLSQVEFRQGYAEEMPVADGTVDVILSNCVINLAEDKGKVFQEAFRVMKPNGRLEVSDIVFGGPVLPDMRSQAPEWAACVAGALPEAEYLDLVAQAGFEQVKVTQRTKAGEAEGISVYSAQVSARKPVQE